MSAFLDKRVWVVGTVMVASSVCALLLTHRPPEPAPGIAAESAIITAKTGPAVTPQPAAHSYPGVILARNAVDLAPKIDGTLEELKVELGQHVEKGAVVAVVDVGPVRQDLEIAQAELSGARAQLERARIQHHLSRDEVDRDTKIASQLSDADLSKSRANRGLASAQVREAVARVAQNQAKVDQLQEMVSSGQIKAPFDGVVTERYLATGARVSRTTPILRLIGQNAFGVRFAVPGDDARRVQAGMPVRVEIDGSDLALDGQVENVSPEIDPSIQTLVAKAKLNTTEGNAAHIPSGQSAKIFVLGEPVHPTQR